MPGISGTYGRAGWGGRKVNGKDGWSARGSFGLTFPEGNPLAGKQPLGWYCYHADMEGNYGSGWVWTQGYRGFLDNNRWYCVEQYVKLNTPGQDGGQGRPRRHPPRLDRRPARLREDRHPLPRRGHAEDRADLDERVPRRHDALAARSAPVRGQRRRRQEVHRPARRPLNGYVRLGSITPPRPGTLGLGEGGDRSGRQVDRERAADAERAFDGHAAAMRLHDVLDDRQAQAGAAELAAAGPIDAVEPLEDPREVLGGDAAAAIGDGDQHFVGRRRGD